MISKKLLKKHFRIEKDLSYITLYADKARNSISIKENFELDEDVASLAGLMPDGSLIKDLRRIYFHQKKDIRKIFLFKDLIKKLFNPNNKIFIRNGCGCADTYVNSKTLAMFFYNVLDISKSDEPMKVPNWLFLASKSVKIAYLKQAFDMEGTILKRLYEIRFITKDKGYAEDIQKLLLQLGITSHVKERIGGTHRTIQYRVSIYRKENFVKFKDIGFSVPFNQDRFKELCSKYSI